MKKYSILLFINLILITFTTNAQNWQWAKSILGSNGDVEVAATKTDDLNNIYVYGFFNNEIENAAGLPVTSLGSKDVFLAKYNENGSLQWMRFGQGTSVESPQEMAIDQSGNVYLLGDTKGDCTFSDAVTPLTITNTNTKFDIFLVKYDTDGNLQFAKNIGGGVQHNRAGTIFANRTNNQLIITGQYTTENIFSPTITQNSLLLNDNGSFIAKFDYDGNYISHSNINIPVAGGSSIFVDIEFYNNNYYFIGSYAGTVDFQASQFSSSNNTDFDLIIYKTDMSFNEIWSKSITSTGLEYSYNIIAGVNGIYVAGYSNGPTLTFEATVPVVATLDGSSYDGFTAKYDLTGNLLNTQLYSSNGNVYFSDAQPAGERVLYTGYFNDTLIINTDTLISSNLLSTDVFWTASDIDNAPIYGEKTFGTANDKGRATIIDSNSELILTGSFISDPFIFTSEYGSQDTLHSATLGMSDGFLAKYTLCGDYDIRFYVDSTTCPASNDGKTTAIVFKDQTVGADTIQYDWNYLWSTTETNDTIENLSIGWYYLTLTNKYGCVYTDSVLVSNLPTVTSQLTDTVTLNCFYDLLASEIVTANLGQPPYTYQWANTVGSSIDSAAYDLPVGIHYVTVTDNCGSQIVDSIIINHIPTLTSTISTHNTIIACASGADGEAWMNSNFGYGTITYAWENSASTNYIASDLSIGLHHVTVTDGCISLLDSVNVVNLPTMNAEINAHTNVSCLGNTDGTANLFVVGGVQPYSFIWSSGETIEDATALTEGMNYVTVSDACTSVIDSVEITLEPSLQIQLLANHETCSGANGHVIVVATHGSGNYNYTWDTLPSSGTPISTNDTVYNLSANTYYVTVSDDCGSKTDSIILTSNAILDATLSSHTEILNCETSNNGTVTVIASNGVTPYIYNWSSSASTSATASDLTVGVEYVTITDQCGTSIIDSITIGFYPKLISYAEHMSDANCTFTNDGQASVIATGGVQPYTYTWSNSSSTLNIATDLPAGIQYVTVSDYCGTAIDSIQIGVLPSFSYTLVSTETQCANDSLGTITLTTTNGVAPFTFDWGISSTENTNYIDSLWVGMHYVTLSDVCGSITDSIEVNALPSFSFTMLTSDPQCPNDSLANITLTALNGVLPYSYNWGISSNLDTNYIDSLWVGMHYVTVTDGCNMPQTDSIEVYSTAPLVASLATHNLTIYCENGATGQNEIIANGGIMPYSYTWSNGENTSSVNNLSVGYQYVSVSDRCNDLIVDSVYVSYLPSMVIDVTASDPLCYNDSNGTIELQISQGIHPYQILWDNNSTEHMIDSLNAGTYSYTVTDQCDSYENSITLNNPDSLIIAANITDESITDAMDGSIIITISGGTSPYQFIWSNGLNNQDLVNISYGTYALTILDYNNCSLSASFELSSNKVTIEPVDAFTPNGDGVNETWTIKNIDKFPTCEVKIFNQWGNLVFESTGYNDPWDGTSNGKELSAAVYYFVIDLKNNENPSTGSITLIR